MDKELEWYTFSLGFKCSLLNFAHLKKGISRSFKLEHLQNTIAVTYIHVGFENDKDKKNLVAICNAIVSSGSFSKVLH